MGIVRRPFGSAGAQIRVDCFFSAPDCLPTGHAMARRFGLDLRGAGHQLSVNSARDADEVCIAATAAASRR